MVTGSVDDDYLCGTLIIAALFWSGIDQSAFFFFLKAFDGGVSACDVHPVVVTVHEDDWQAVFAAGFLFENGGIGRGDWLCAWCIGWCRCRCCGLAEDRA
jgi:hypothetical protein